MKFLAEKYDFFLDDVVSLRAENKELKAGRISEGGGKLYQTTGQ